MSEIENVGRQLLQAYQQELNLVRALQENLKQQLQAIQAGAWGELDGLIAMTAAGRERLSRARQDTRQLEGLLAMVSGSEGPDWEGTEILPSTTCRELAGAARQLRSCWEECRELQEAALQRVHQAVATARGELEQIQTARQMARVYRRKNRTALPRCLDRQL
ncbi:MAG: flagellar export chaperone FlgN [Moorella sp. (in: Bacteria)]|nr:flagellar export chaperone FlgN [Moorella sp. (in: firmicutes)]